MGMVQRAIVISRIGRPFIMMNAKMHCQHSCHLGFTFFGRVAAIRIPERNQRWKILFRSSAPSSTSSFFSSTSALLLHHPARLQFFPVVCPLHTFFCPSASRGATSLAI